MEVNGKLIKGIFLYDAEVKFTEGDFVVEGNKMYVCTESSIGNLPSITPSSYKPYLGAPTSGEVDDSSTSFVSSLALGKYLSGTCNMKGTIPNDIDANREAFFRDFFGNESGLSLGDRYLDPLDNLIVSGINQTVVNVDKTVAEGILGACNNNPLLRQYTYQSSPTLWTRVQELVNVDSGDTYYRTSSKTVEGENVDDYSWSSPTDWNNVSVNGTYKETIAQIKSYYTQKCHEMDILKTKLLGTFRFKRVDIVPSASVVLQSPPSSIITVCLRSTGSSISEVHSVTIDLDHNISRYGVADGIYLSVSQLSSGVTYVLQVSRLDYAIYDVYERVPFDYTPQPNPIEYIEDIPVVRSSGTVYRIIITGGMLKGPFIKVSLSDNFAFVFPVTERQVDIIRVNGAVRVERFSSAYFQMIVQNIPIEEVKAAYVNLTT